MLAKSTNGRKKAIIHFKKWGIYSQNGTYTLQKGTYTRKVYIPSKYIEKITLRCNIPYKPIEPDNRTQ